MKFIDLFSGIGGFRLAMEQSGHECAAFCEIDKFARKSYKAIHDTEGELEMHDITTVSDESIRGIGDIDIICGGFPCQAFSIAGKRRGFEDTRGTLFFEIARFASILRPRYLFLENVKGLLNHEGGVTFEIILRTLDELGYDVEWQVLNSKDYVPQNRERIFIIGHLRGECTRKVFPIRKDGETVDRQYRIKKIGIIRKKGKSQSGDVISINGIAPTMCSTTTQKDPIKIVEGGLYTNDSQEFSRGLLPNLSRTIKSQNHDAAILIREATAKGFTMASSGDSINISHPNSKTRRGRVGKGIANTLLTGEEQAVVTENLSIRKLTPKECWRLQGFPDWAFDRAKEVNSDSQLYKQAGNSVTVPVICDIARRLKGADE